MLVGSSFLMANVQLVDLAVTSSIEDIQVFTSVAVFATFLMVYYAGFTVLLVKEKAAFVTATPAESSPEAVTQGVEQGEEDAFRVANEEEVERQARATDIALQMKAPGVKSSPGEAAVPSISTRVS